YRTDVFSLDGIAGSQREYIHWLLNASAVEGAEIDTILTEDAVDLLATKLRTPLQIQLHLTLALEAGYQAGERPVSAEVVESVLSRQMDDLEPTLT
ncbi:AAA family ATPase, partial [Acidithiobacillus ferrivorans]|nr:AAA family ATPase [Acidithiobacillus ferrivorans]